MSKSGEFVIFHITSEETYKPWIASLSRLLQSCINTEPASSSLGFLSPLSSSKASTYWESLTPSLCGPSPTTILFILSHTSPSSPYQALGTVQLAVQDKETHSHKVEARKLLIAIEDRRLGLGKMLMEAAEKYASEELGVCMVVLSTMSETPARKFYLNLGYTEWGVCPKYAANALGELKDVSFFFKKLRAAD